MTALVDTSIRLLGQEPLAGRVPAGDLYKIAELLDGAGFAYLDVSGGGCFEAAVRRHRLDTALRLTLHEDDTDRLRTELEALLEEAGALARKDGDV